MLLHATNNLVKGNRLIPRPRQTRRGDSIQAVFAARPHPRLLAFAFKVNVGSTKTYIFTINETAIMVRGSKDDYLKSVAETGYIYSLPEAGFVPVEEADGSTPHEYVSFSPVDLSNAPPKKIELQTALKNGLQIYFFKPSIVSAEQAERFYKQVPKYYSAGDLLPLIEEYADSYNLELREAGHDVSYIPSGEQTIKNLGKFNTEIATLLGHKAR